MRCFVLLSRLATPPDKFWSENIATHDVLSVSEGWPRTRIRESPSLLIKERVQERTIDRAPGGSEVCDLVKFEPRRAIFGPWLKAAQIMSLRSRHYEMRVRYGWL